MKLPISSPIKPRITQLYGDTSNAAWYQANGMNMTAHNGVDFVVGDETQTYGTRLVCPVKEAEISQSWWDSPLSTKGNGIQIAWEEGKDRFNLRFWHCSEIVVRSSYKEGDVVAYIGNSGLCSPAPTDTKPFAGSHLHLMLYKNGVLIDPLTVFDKEQWYVAIDTGVDKDLPPLNRVLKFIIAQVDLLKAKLFK